MSNLQNQVEEFERKSRFQAPQGARAEGVSFKAIGA